MYSDLLFFFKLPNLIIIVYINRLILIYKSCHLMNCGDTSNLVFPQYRAPFLFGERDAPMIRLLKN